MQLFSVRASLYGTSRLQGPVKNETSHNNWQSDVPRQVSLGAGEPWRRALRGRAHAHTHNILRDGLGRAGGAGKTPLFVTDLKVEGTELVFSPSLETVRGTVLTALADVVRSATSVEDQLDDDEDDVHTLLVLDKHDPVLHTTKERLESVLVEALKGPAALMRSYEKFSYLLKVDGLASGGCSFGCVDSTVISLWRALRCLLRKSFVAATFQASVSVHGWHSNNEHFRALRLKPGVTVCVVVLFSRRISGR